MKVVHVFIDTNIFLHYRPLEDIPWKSILEVDEVVLCIAPIVVEELDEHKDNHRLSKIRERALKALQIIEHSFKEADSELRKGVSLQYMDEPDISFSDYGLRDDKPDDNLVASLLSLNSTADAQVVLVTGDTGPRLKAARLDLPCMELAEEYKADSALDEVEREKRKIQAELNRLKNRLPVLDLVFESDDKHSKFQVSDYDPLTEEEIGARLNEIIEQYPRKSFQPVGESEELEEPKSFGEMVKASMASFNQPSEQQIERYNDRLDDFYDQYKEYLQKREIIEDAKRRLITLDIVIKNMGSAPAEYIDIFMYFPDGFRLFSDETLPSFDLDEPVPPHEPKGGFPSIAAGFPGVSSPVLNMSYQTPPPGNVSSPNIKETNSYDVDLSISKLKHNMREQCGPFYVLFDSAKTASSFSIDYRINAADLPDEIEGTLHVVI